MMLAGGILSFLDVALMLTLIGCALWKTGWIRMGLSICLIIWGAFAIRYDIKVAAPLFVVGAALFMQMIVTQIQQARKQVQE